MHERGRKNAARHRDVAFEAVLRIEFSPAVAERALAQVTGTTITVGYRMHVRRKHLPH